MPKGIVSVKWIPPKMQETTMIETQTIKIEMDEDEPDKIWIWMLEDGQQVEGGAFNMSDFMDCILQFYRYHY